ncbi:MAG: DNA translocase FtsK [Verrucomicrobiota bacterium]
MSDHKSLPTLVEPPQVAPVHNRRHWQEAAALACAGIAVLYALALATYTPNDLPEWIPFSQTAEVAGGDSEVRNWVGPAGAIVAGLAFYAFGAASYLIPLVILWVAVAIWIERKLPVARTLAATCALLLSAACLTEFQPFVFGSMVDTYNLPESKGGFGGLWVGRFATKGTIGHAGGVSLMAVIFLISAVFVGGSHPFRVKSKLRQKMSDRTRRKTEERVSRYHYSDQPTTEFDVYADADPVAQVNPIPNAQEPVFVTPVQDQAPVSAANAEQVVEPAPARSGPNFAGAANVVEPEPTAEVPLGREDPVPLATPQHPHPQHNPSPTTPPPYQPKVNDTNRSRSSSVDFSSMAASFSPKAGKEQFADYILPSLDILNDETEDETPLTDQAELIETQEVIISTLKTFGLAVQPGDITRGPTVTRYEIYPSEGMRVKQIAALEADIARATRAECINILAPIPGKDTVGIEIANNRKVLVPLRKLLEQPEFVEAKMNIPIALGKDVYGKTIVADLAAMPHLLVAGATGSGKSVCINSIIASLLFRFTPDQLRIIMIDPKVVEMQVYHTLPHLAVPVVTDPKKVLLALQWCINEMERRYELFARYGCRKLEEYNKLASRPYVPGKPKPENPDQMQFDDMLLSDPTWEESNPNPKYSSSRRQPKQHPLENNDPDFLPFVVVIIDELADLMQTAPANVETSINRLCQKARAAGIHLIVATQSPRVDVVTGLIKANIPARIAFQVSSATDSRVILDKSGADKLVGKGDMLFQPPDSPVSVRAQGAFLTDSEVQEICDHCGHQAEPVFEPGVQRALQGEPEPGPDDVSLADEETVARCIDVILTDGKASTSFLQRRLRLGYNRAARMMDLLEERGIVGPGDGAKPREILISAEDEEAMSDQELEGSTEPQIQG